MNSPSPAARTKHRVIRFLTALSAIWALLLATESVAGDYITQGKWRDGRLTWYYNNSLRPDGVTDAQFVALASQAFGLWSAGCNISVQYGGATTVPAQNASAIAANTVVIGFAPLAANVGGDASPFSNDAASSNYFFTSGVVRISSNNTPYNLVSDRLLYILVHEIGHLLNIAHSDEPYSVMYANPFLAVSSAAQPYNLYADDIATCANLYGAKGVQPTVDNGATPFLPASSYGISTGVGNIDSSGGVLIAAGSAQDSWQAAPQNTVDLSLLENAPWFRLAWNATSTVKSATLSIISPSGDVVLDNYSVGWQGSSIANGYFPFRSYLWMNGNWKLRASVNGSPAAETAFTTINGLSSPAKLEAAAIVESATSGNLSLRLVNYSSVGVLTSWVFPNGRYAASAQSFPAAAGSNVIEFWAQSDIPRYRAGLGCGQPAVSSDFRREVNLFADNSGSIAGSSLNFAESGTLIAYSAQGTVQTAAAGQQNVFVAAMVGNALLFRRPDGGWSDSATALFSYASPGAAVFDILRDFDTRALPPGTTLYVGVGQTLSDMLAARQYRVVRTF